MKRCPALTLSPEEVARRLVVGPSMVWFDSAGPGREGERQRSILSAWPCQVLTGSLFHADDVLRLRAALAEMKTWARPDQGLGGPGLYGSVDFDGRFTFGQYEEVLVYDHTTDEWWEVGTLGEKVLALPEQVPAKVALDFSTEWKEEAYLQAVMRALDYIAAGDIYQVNLAHSWQSPWPRHTSALGFYEKLRAFSPAPYAAYLQLGERQMLSVSPELFLKIDGQQVMTRPIKGTRPRYRDPDEDERSAYELMTSAKEIAELVMITDLERNDLGQVCEYGSVRVSELLKLERYAQVFHLVSTVEGTVRAELDHIDVLRACFPGGSISGAPKKRALTIINELEPIARQWYTGAVGYLGAYGESQFNIAIRTAVVEDETIRFFTGSGIVADSDPSREYEETWHKAASLLGAAKWQQAEPKTHVETESRPLIHQR